MPSRREFISKTVAVAGLGYGLSQPRTAHKLPEHSGSIAGDFKLSIFSKNLQWLDYSDMAETAARLGFDGVDLTVRPGGHVEPARVTVDLPRAVEAVKKSGLEIYSIVTAIDDAAHPHTEDILRTASSLQIAHYRLGWFHYDPNKPIADSLKDMTKKMRELEILNGKHRIYGSYQNHAGRYFGAAVWDLAMILREIDAKWTGSQYDIYHATIEGANSWIYGFDLIAPFIKTINFKDYHWIKRDNRWVTESVPLGTGAVDLNTYLSLLKKFELRCPVSVHYEYPLGTADQGGRSLTIPKETVLSAMERDLGLLKAKMKESGLR